MTISHMCVTLMYPQLLLVVTHVPKSLTELCPACSAWILVCGACCNNSAVFAIWLQHCFQGYFKDITLLPLSQSYVSSCMTAVDSIIWMFHLNWSYISHEYVYFHRFIHVSYGYMFPLNSATCMRFLWLVHICLYTWLRYMCMFHLTSSYLCLYVSSHLLISMSTYFLIYLICACFLWLVHICVYMFPLDYPICACFHWLTLINVYVYLFPLTCMYVSSIQ